MHLFFCAFFALVGSFHAESEELPLPLLANRGNAAASDVRAVGQEVKARLRTWETDNARVAAEGQVEELKQGVPYAENLEASAKRQRGLAAVAAKDTGDAKVMAQNVAPPTIAKAAKIAGETTAPDLEKLAKNFAEWKMAVQHDPMMEANIAAQKAAAPYERAVMVVEKRVAEYQQRADGLNGQAFGIQKLASDIANTAVQKQANVDLKGAAADMMTSHQLMAQAAQYGKQSLALSKQAQILQLNIPLWQGAAAMAASGARYRNDPKNFPPPPVPFPVGFPPPSPDVGPSNIVEIQPAVLLEKEAARKPVRKNPFAK